MIQKNLDSIIYMSPIVCLGYLLFSLSLHPHMGVVSVGVVCNYSLQTCSGKTPMRTRVHWRILNLQSS